jgi:excisionase family DNA binding protein
VTVHDDLQAIPDRVTQLERHVAALELAYLELTKQNAAVRRGAVTRQTYTITEAASLFGCTRTQVYEMIAANRLHAFTVGTHARRIPADEVRRLLADPTMASTGATRPSAASNTLGGSQTPPKPQIEPQRPI